jgi:hypothetical protein
VVGGVDRCHGGRRAGRDPALQHGSDDDGVGGAGAQPAGPGNMQVINLNGHRNSKFTCTDTNKHKSSKRRPGGCTATCPARCPNMCLVLCPTCKTFCCKLLILCFFFLQP